MYSQLPRWPLYTNTFLFQCIVVLLMQFLSLLAMVHRETLSHAVNWIVSSRYITVLLWWLDIFGYTSNAQCISGVMHWALLLTKSTKYVWHEENEWLLIIQDGLTAFDLASLEGHAKVCQELHVLTTRPQGKQHYYPQPFISFTNRVKCMSYCSSVSDQGVEEDEDEPEPPQPFEWTEDWVAALQTGPEHP